MKVRKNHGKAYLKLTPQLAIFVAEYVRTSHLSNSVIKAGGSAKTALRRGHAWMRVPCVIEAIEKATQKIVKVTKHDYEVAMAEAESLREKAEEAGNLGIVSQMVIHKARLAGLMVERHQVQAGFSINISGITGPLLEASKDVTPTLLPAILEKTKEEEETQTLEDLL